MQRTINYRTVEWFGQVESLVQLITTTLAGRPHVDQTAYIYGSEVCEVRHRNIAPNEIRLHISMHVPGAQKGVRPNTVNVAEGDLSSAPPPANAEFTERELAIVVRDNCIGYVAAGRALSSTVRNALAGLVRLHHGPDIAKRFNLSARADPAIIQQMLHEGVDIFELGVSLAHADAAQIVEGQPHSLARGVGSSIWDSLSARLLEDHPDTDINQLANMNVTLNIKAGRTKDQAKIDTLTALATEAVENEDEFAIRTLSNARVTRDKLIITSSFDQPGDVPVLSYVVAWGQIAAFLDTVQ